MNLLLDTCVLIWMDGRSEKLSAIATEVIKDPSNGLFMSSVSAWEVIQKVKLGKLPLWGSPVEVLRSLKEDYGVLSLAFDEADAELLVGMDLHHKDPFDLMLICQARANNLTLVTPDPAIRQYPIPVLW